MNSIALIFVWLIFIFFLLRSFNWISSGFLFLFLGRWWGRAQEAPVDGTGHHQRNISRSFSQTARRERFRPSQHMWVLFIHIHMKKKTNLSLHWLFHYFGSPFIYLFLFSFFFFFFFVIIYFVLFCFVFLSQNDLTFVSTFYFPRCEIDGINVLEFVANTEKKTWL